MKNDVKSSPEYKKAHHKMMLNMRLKEVYTIAKEKELMEGDFNGLADLFHTFSLQAQMVVRREAARITRLLMERYKDIDVA